MNLNEEKIFSKEIYKGKVLNLFLDDVKLPNGEFSKREYVKHNGGAAMLLVKDNKALLVKQFRYAYGKEMYEIPAGKLEIGEDPQIAAERELCEETGYLSKKTTPIGKIYPSPGYTNEVIYIFKSDEFVKDKQHLDDDEFLNVEFLPINEVLCLIENGEICDAKTITAVYKYLLISK